MPSVVLTSEKYNGRPVVLVDGYKYYFVSRHKTNFNACRQHRRLDYKGKIRKVGKWWVILQGLPGKYQMIRRML